MAFNMTRRKFLQTASLAAASVPLSKVVTADTGFVKKPFTPPGSFADTQTVTGGICEMCFWRCQGQADLTIPFNETGEMTMDMEFKVLDGILDFAGATIASTSCERLFRVIKEIGSGMSPCDPISV